MKYDFDKPTDRRNTGSVKWDVAEGELPMWVADMDFETAPAVKSAIMKIAERGIFGYVDVTFEYFKSISDFWYERYGYRFDPEHMIYSSGVVGAISSIVRKITTPGEKVLIQPPVYNVFYNSIVNNGRFVVENELVYRNGEYEIDFADLEAKLQDPQTSLMILCNPHNPVGKIWQRDTLIKIGELCKKHGVTVVSDEIHSSFTVPGRTYIPFASASEVCADVSITCVSASKSFNIAGLQSASVIVKDPILRHKVWRGLNTDEVGEPNVFAVEANIAAFKYGGEWLDQLNEYIFSNKRYAENYVNERIEGLIAVKSDATYLLWVDVSAYTDNSEEFAKDLRLKTGLYVSDGVRYGKGGERFLRINLATQRKNVEDGMARLEKYVNDLRKGN